MKRRFSSSKNVERTMVACGMAFAGAAALWLASLPGCSAQKTVEIEVNETVEPIADAPVPVAVVDETDGYLGILDASEEIEKLFVIRNEGEAPLLLERGGTSCTCTMSALPDKPIMPGEAAVVRVSTKSEEKEGKFDHTASVLTNDPQNPCIKFRVSGEFRDVISFEPPVVAVIDMKRGESTTVQTVAYSQLYRDFELESIDSTLDGLSWEVQRAEKFTLNRLNARCAYRLKLTVPAEVTTGDFSETLSVTVRSDDDPPKERKATCRLVGSVQARADISGKKVTVGRTLNIGSLRRWEGTQERLTLTVRDDHRRLLIKAIEKTPDFLNVDVAPMVPEKPDSGLYWVHVTIPKDAPTCNYVGSRKGEVRIVTDHPGLPVMSFWVQFAISGS